MMKKQLNSEKIFGLFLLSVQVSQMCVLRFSYNKFL